MTRIIVGTEAEAGAATDGGHATVAFLPRSCYNDLQLAMLPQAIVNGLVPA